MTQMMRNVSRILPFQAAHRLYDRQDHERQLHGHSYRVEARVMAEDLYLEGEECGSIISSNDLYEFMQRYIIKVVDHKTILQKTDPLVKVLPEDHLVVIPLAPTPEFLAQTFFTWMIDSIRFKVKSFKSLRLTVWETEYVKAAYIGR